MSKECKHLDFNAKVIVNRLEDKGLFNADVEIWCKDCGLPFKFVGLPMGLNLFGATVDVGKTEARLAIKPCTEEEKQRWLEWEKFRTTKVSETSN